MSTPARSLLALLAAAAIAHPAWSQQQPSSPPTSTLRTGTQIVVVDVTVTDRSGNPVKGLKAEDFEVTEERGAQRIAAFDEHTVGDRPAPTVPPMPPGIFSNLAAPPTGVLTVIVFDTLNSGLQDEIFARRQLIELLKNAPPQGNIAILGLNTGVTLLHGFTSDTAVLLQALEHSAQATGSPLRENAVGASIDDVTPEELARKSGIVPQNVIDRLRQFDAQRKASQTIDRAHLTLDAFNLIARYLSGFPGRKNLIWYSTSFPLSIAPDPTIPDPFATQENVEAEFRDTIQLLAKSQVAVYPVDARGLVNAGAVSALNSGEQYFNNSKQTHSELYEQDLRTDLEQRSDEHTTMNEMAAATGGQAFFNTNGLAAATAEAIRTGSNYYTLTYSPTNRDWKGDYRRIRIELRNGAAPSSAVLHYRRGYYAYPPNSRQSVRDGLVSAQAASAIASAGNLSRLAMEFGAPEPHDLVFKARVLPAGTADEDTPAPGNNLPPSSSAKPPFRRFVVDVVIPIQQVKLTSQPDGTLQAAISVRIFLYDPEGRVLNTVGLPGKIAFAPAKLDQVTRTGIQFHAAISVPIHGRSYLRIGVQDETTAKFGAVEVPIASVASLPPQGPPAVAR